MTQDQHAVPSDAERRLARRVFNVMRREMIHSEHGALCFIEACRRDRAKARAAKKARKV